MILGPQPCHGHHRLQGQQGRVAAKLLVLVRLLLQLVRQVPDPVATGGAGVREALACCLLQGRQGRHGHGGARAAPPAAVVSSDRGVRWPEFTRWRSTPRENGDLIALAHGPR